MDKGSYGYYNNYKKKKGLWSLAFAIVIAILVALCFIIYGTNKTTLIVPAVVLVLPFSKFLIAYLMGAKYTSISSEDYKLLEDTYGNDDSVILLYDMTISTAETVLGVPVIALYDGNIYYIEHAKNNAKYKAILRNVFALAIEDARYKDECESHEVLNVSKLVESIDKAKVEEPRDNASLSIKQRLLVLCL